MRLKIKLDNLKYCNRCPCYTLSKVSHPYCKYYHIILELGFDDFMSHKTYSFIPRPKKCIEENGV